MATNPNEAYLQAQEQLIRSIVRDELSRMFSGPKIQREDREQYEETVKNGSTNGGSTSNGRSEGGKKGGRRKGRGKGRAVNPATDRRFKQNREQEERQNA